MRDIIGKFGAAVALLALTASSSCRDAFAPSINELDFLLADADRAWICPAATSLSIAHTPKVPMRIDADLCAYDGRTQTFVCPQRFWNYLTFELSYQLLDASGNPLAEYDASTVASVRTVTSVTGKVTFTASRSQQIDAAGERILSGLLSGEPTVNGTERAMYIMTEASRMDTAYTETSTVNLRLPPNHAPGFPSGTIVSHYFSAPPRADSRPDRTFTMTFGGSQIATLVWSSEGYASVCGFDIARGAKTSCSQ